MFVFIIYREEIQHCWCLCFFLIHLLRSETKRLQACLLGYRFLRNLPTKHGMVFFTTGKITLHQLVTTLHPICPIETCFTTILKAIIFQVGHTKDQMNLSTSKFVNLTSKVLIDLFNTFLATYFFWEPVP